MEQPRAATRFGMRAFALITALAAGACGGAPSGQEAPASQGASAAHTAPGTADASPATDGPDGGTPDGATDANAPPVFSSEQWSVLQSLSPAELPGPPADPTNRFADSAAAATLGQRLFFDPSFSGQLLDTDNDGSPSALGMATPTSGQTGRVACAGCHLSASGFSDTRSFQRQISLGAGWGRRRAPSLLDVAQTKLVTWDGRRDSLFSQVFGPLETVVEMNSSRLFMAEQIFQNYKADYEAIFGPMPALGDSTQFPPLAADVTGCLPKNRGSPPTACDGTFHGMPGDHAEYDGMTAERQTAVTAVVANAGKAIAAFERRLSCGSSPFDAWMHGDPTAISSAAQRGAGLFAGRAGCVGCHSGPFLSDQSFHNVGLSPQVVQQDFVDSNDDGQASGFAQLMASQLNSTGPFSDGTDGRIPAAATPAMKGAFLTPMLRCVSTRPTFMHTGQIGSLDDVVAFFAKGGDSTGYSGVNELKPLSLSAEDQSDLVAFLTALQGPGAPAALQTSPPLAH